MGAYLISGLSGTGKTSVQKELVRRGYLAIETGLKVPDNQPLPEKTVPRELVRMLGWNQNYRQDHADDGTICIDGTMATSRITDEVLEYVHAS